MHLRILIFQRILPSHTFVFLLRITLIEMGLCNCFHVVSGLEERVRCNLVSRRSFFNLIDMCNNFYVAEHPQAQTECIEV